MFAIESRQSSVGREILGGVTTFMAMSYILFVQPAVLSKAGMDTGGVFMATCISSAAACILMGLLANYPIALAPGMGENFFFVFTLCGVGAAAAAFKLTWQEALALTVLMGLLFLLMAFVGLRAKILNSIPDSLKNGIAAGIGLFIALIGFEWGNIVRTDAVTGVALADMQGNYAAGLTLLGVVVILLLLALNIRGAMLIGILAITAATWAVGRIWDVSTISYKGIFGMPVGLENTAGGFLSGFAGLWDKLAGPHWMEVIGFAFILLFMDLFDTVGTLVGVARRSGLMVHNQLPRAQYALSADAAGTVIGASLGSSTVTSYIESVTGVASGARTGLAAIVAGVLMLAAMFFQPVVEMVGGGVVVGTYEWGDPIVRYPMIAPALIVVGCMMLRPIVEIQWEDATESIPAFLTMVTMPFAYSISHGIAIGFITYAAGKLVTGRPRQCPAIVYIFAVLFALRYILLPV